MSRKTIADQEAGDAQVLAKKMGMSLRERLAFLEHEARRKRPSIDSIRREGQALRECIDRELAKYDAKHGTESEWVQTESRLRQLIDKQTTYINELHVAVEWQQQEVRKHKGLLSQCVPLVSALVGLCHDNGVAIPDNLMGGSLQ